MPMRPAPKTLPPGSLYWSAMLANASSRGIRNSWGWQARLPPTESAWRAWWGLWRGSGRGARGWRSLQRTYAERRAAWACWTGASRCCCRQWGCPSLFCVVLSHCLCGFGMAVASGAWINRKIVLLQVKDITWRILKCTDDLYWLPSMPLLNVNISCILNNKSKHQNRNM